MDRLCLCLLLALILGLGACATTPNSNPVAIDEQILKPEGAGPFPAVIILHTTRGVTADEHLWATRFVKAGYAALVLDSGGVGRGGSGPAYQWRLDEVKSVMRQLQSHPAIIGDRIAMLGRSHGAGVALMTLANKIEPAPRAVVSLFPRCDRVVSWKVDVPVLYLLGGNDRITPPRSCEQIAASLSRKGLPVRAVTYPGVGHFFDASGGEADRQAEQEVMAFLSTHLRTP